MTLGQEKKSFVYGEKKKAQTIKGKTKKQTIAYHKNTVYKLKIILREKLFVA